MDFAKKYGPWALVVGASEGLGAAFADNCAARGLNVALVARRAPEMEEVAAGLRARHGVETREILADASKPEFLEAVQAGTQGLEIGFLIFNAGMAPGGPFLRIRLKSHLRAIHLQCIAPTEICHWLGQEMAGRGRGGIVLVGSGSGLQGMAGFASYSASKAYELTLAEALWDEFRDQGVTVAGYVVGSTATPNFMRVQQKHDLPLAGNIEAKDLPKDAPIPRSPEEVAAALFPQLEDGPRLFPDPAQRAAAEAAARLSRNEAVARAGESTKKYFSGGLNSLAN